MRLLRALLLLALACGLTHPARAFQMVVIDPTYSYTDVLTTTFPFTFSTCDSSDPTVASYDGCFVGKNLTGSDLTSLQITVPNTISGQSAGCSLTGTGLDVFSLTSCGPGPGGVGYVLTFSGGDIKYGQFFTIAESGADPSDFGTMTAVASTPEPDSMLLLSTGVLFGGLFFVNQRRLAGITR